MQVQPFEPRSLQPLIHLINLALRGRRNACRISVQDFRSRVLEHPGFDPAGLLTIFEGGELRGAVHAIAPVVELPRYAPLEGRGYIMGPFVRPESRGQGAGKRLLSAAESYLRASCNRILVHGLRTPFYHAQEGPRQPYCGSTEMIGLTQDDAFLLDFYLGAGYRLRKGEREISMLASFYTPGKSTAGGHISSPGEWRLRGPQQPGGKSPFEGHFPIASGLPVGLDWVSFSYQMPWKGPVDYVDSAEGFGYQRFRPMGDYSGLGLRLADCLVGDCIWFPLRRPGRAALYSLRLGAAWRGQRLGRRLLDGGLRIMRTQGYGEVELHTSPERNGVAYAMYSARGFRQVAEWTVLEKRL
jgi:GNAT superfamily N-acetyltransferase